MQFKQSNKQSKHPSDPSVWWPSDRILVFFKLNHVIDEFQYIDEFQLFYGRGNIPLPPRQRTPPLTAVWVRTWLQCGKFWSYLLLFFSIFLFLSPFIFLWKSNSFYILKPIPLTSISDKCMYLISFSQFNSFLSLLSCFLFFCFIFF